MAAQTVDRFLANRCYRMLVDRVPNPVSQRQSHYLAEVVFRQFHFAIEDGYQMRVLQFSRTRIGTMTLQAEGIRRARSQQMLVVSAVWCMACCTTLLECRLVQVLFLMLVRLVGMAVKACIHRIGLDESRRLAGMRIVTIRAIPLRSRMLNLRLLDFFRLIAMAGNAQFLRRRSRQNNLPILRRGMARVTRLIREGWMRKLLQQLRTVRLVRVVSLNAVGGSERLSLVCLHQRGVFYVMTIEAQCRC